MKFGFSVEDAVTRRCSVRTYDKARVENEIKENLLAYAAQLQNPLGPRMRVQAIEKATAADGEKLGTYGVIKGAQLYLAATVSDEEYALEALGYDFEQLVLYASSLGLGTCWLGGTFNRSAFASKIDIGSNEILPILSPVGYPARKKRVSDHIFRRTLKSGARKPWSDIFFQNEFGTPLSKEAAGNYQFPLEMLRQAPSAVNKQPWRIVFANNAFHFFEKHSPRGSSPGFDIQRIDIGIAICHFHLAALERDLAGHFERNCPDIPIPSDTDYVISWTIEE